MLKMAHSRPAMAMKKSILSVAKSAEMNGPPCSSREGLTQPTANLEIGLCTFQRTLDNWCTQMKAWLRKHLHPMDLWGYSLACSYWFLRVCKRWLWNPFLENWLSNNLEDAKKTAQPSGTYTCLQCGEEKNIAFVVCDNVEPSFFCSLSCRHRHALNASIEHDSAELRHPSI